MIDRNANEHPLLNEAVQPRADTVDTVIGTDKYRAYIVILPDSTVRQIPFYEVNPSLAIARDLKLLQVIAMVALASLSARFAPRDIDALRRFHDCGATTPRAAREQNAMDFGYPGNQYRLTSIVRAMTDVEAACLYREGATLQESGIEGLYSSWMAHAIRELARSHGESVVAALDGKGLGAEELGAVAEMLSTMDSPPSRVERSHGSRSTPSNEHLSRRQGAAQAGRLRGGPSPIQVTTEVGIPLDGGDYELVAAVARVQEIAQKHDASLERYLVVPQDGSGEPISDYWILDDQGFTWDFEAFEDLDEAYEILDGFRGVRFRGPTADLVDRSQLLMELEYLAQLAETLGVEDDAE